MTFRARGLTASLALSGALIVNGCSSSTQSVPLTPQLTNIAGEYIGTVQDSVAGAESAATTLAEHGPSIGGSLVLTAGTTTSNEAVAWTLTTANTLSGSGSMDVNGATCTFSMTGAYNPANNQISGSYTAVNGCAGRTGTYTLTQQCSNPTASARRRPSTVTVSC